MKTKNSIRAVSIMVWLLTLTNAVAFYDPSVQRWINRDPIVENGGINLYAFVLNNPVSSTDTWGLDCWKIVVTSGFTHEYFVVQDGTNYWYTELRPGKRGIVYEGTGIACDAADTSPTPWAQGNPSEWKDGKHDLGMKVKEHIPCSKERDAKMLDYVKEQIPAQVRWSLYHAMFNNCKTYTSHLAGKAKEWIRQEKEQKKE